MFSKIEYKGTLEQQYNQLAKQLNALLDGEDDFIANLSNASSLLNQFLSDVNWVGFYLVKNGELVLGPFQGLPACVRIPFGKGVCGTCVSQGDMVVVDNVHDFPGHIACDANSKSEIVIPIRKNGKIIGVLDIDSPIFNRFSNKEEQLGLQLFVQTLEKHI